MSIIFDESEFLSFLDTTDDASSGKSLIQGEDEIEKESPDNEKLLLTLYHRLTSDQQKKILTHIRHVLESVHSTKKINLLKAIEESKNAPVNENLSDIIKDIVK